MTTEAKQSFPGKHACIRRSAGEAESRAIADTTPAPSSTERALKRKTGADLPESLGGDRVGSVPGRAALRGTKTHKETTTDSCFFSELSSPSCNQFYSKRGQYHKSRSERTSRSSATQHEADARAHGIV